MEKLDPLYNPSMTPLEIYKAGGVVWLQNQHKIIERQVKEFEDATKVNILV